MKSKNLLVWLLILVLGLSLSSFLMPLFMDLVAIGVGGVTGQEMGLGFVQSTLAAWPGGNVVLAAMRLQPLTPGGLITDLVAVVFVSCAKALLPVTALHFQKWRLVKYGLLDALESWLIGGLATIPIKWLITRLFAGPIGWAVQLAVGLPLIVLILVVFWLAHKGVRQSGVPAFSMVLAFGRFLVATFILIVWSQNNVAGSFTMLLGILACGFLSLVDAGERGLFSWSR